MNEEYLNRVKIFLAQELPAYRGAVSVSGGKLVFRVPEGRAFQPYYDAVFAAVNGCIARIRNRECDLDFSVQSAVQERDFKIGK